MDIVYMYIEDISYILVIFQKVTNITCNMIVWCYIWQISPNQSSSGVISDNPPPLPIIVWCYICQPSPLTIILWCYIWQFSPLPIIVCCYIWQLLPSPIIVWCFIWQPSSWPSSSGAISDTPPFTINRMGLDLTNPTHFLHLYDVKLDS